MQPLCMEQYTTVTTAISIHLPFIKIFANIHPEQSVDQITAYSEREFHTSMSTSDQITSSASTTEKKNNEYSE